MRNFFANSGRLLGLSIAAVLALVSPASPALSQPASPVGTWDCVMSGNGQNGILFLNFTADTDATNGIGLPIFEGIFVQAGHRKVQTGRNGSTGNTRSGSAGSFTNLFGGGFINGSASGTATNVGADDWLPDSRGQRGYWSYNGKGQVVGSYYTVLSATARITNFFDTCIDEPLQIPLTNGSFTLQVAFCFTNPVIATNYPWAAPDGEVGFTNLIFTNQNFTVGFVGATNDISFVGKVVPGKRLTLLGTSAFGQFTIRGTPLVPVATSLPIDGFGWTGIKVENNFKSVEEFNLSAMGIPNVFHLTGQGPSYTYGTPDTADGTNLVYFALCLISNHKRIGFSIDQIPFGTSPSLAENRTTIGPLTNTRKTISTKGIGDSTADPNLIKFNASLVPFIVP